MNQKLIEGAFRVAIEMAANRGLHVHHAALMQAVMAVAGDVDGQDEPEEIAEDALDLLGKSVDPSSSRRGHRPF